MTSTKEMSLLLLGFSETSNPTEEEVKAAFRRVAKILHPDGGGSEEQFRCLSLAKDLLISSAPKPRKAEPTPAQRKAQAQKEFEQEKERQKRREKEHIEYLKQSISKLGVSLVNGLAKRVKRLTRIEIPIAGFTVKLMIKNQELDNIVITGDSEFSYFYYTLLALKLTSLEATEQYYKYWDKDITIYTETFLSYYSKRYVLLRFLKAILT